MNSLLWKEGDGLGRALRAGILDRVPADLPDKLAPKLVDHLDRVLGNPKVTEYYARFS